MATYQGVLDALGDDTRRLILTELRNGPATVAALADQLPVSRPAVSQHLKILRHNGLVTFDPVGTSNVYRLDVSGLRELRRWLDDFWDIALTSFTAYAERSYREEDHA